MILDIGLLLIGFVVLIKGADCCPVLDCQQGDPAFFAGSNSSLFPCK